jgi:hypothetical protein
VGRSIHHLNRWRHYILHNVSSDAVHGARIIDHANYTFHYLRSLLIFSISFNSLNGSWILLISRSGFHLFISESVWALLMDLRSFADHLDCGWL